MIKGKRPQSPYGHCRETLGEYACSGPNYLYDW